MPVCLWVTFITPLMRSFFFFFFNDTATTEIYTLSLHDALPIYDGGIGGVELLRPIGCRNRQHPHALRSEEHTSELQSPCNLVCRLLLEKKKKTEVDSFASPIYYKSRLFRMVPRIARSE